MKCLSTIYKLIGGMLLFSGLALADYQIDFTIPGFAPGSITYNGGSGPLTGSSIGVSSVTGMGGTANSNVLLNCNNCFLNFQTGSLTSQSSGTYTFGSGGTFTLTGTIAGTGISGTLLSGSFASSTINTIGPFMFDSAFFSTAVNQALTSYYGMPSSPPNYAGGLSVLFTGGPGTAPNSFASTQIFSGNIAASVPEPASMILLGTVLLACAAIARRRTA
ncbi:MAG TPA: PEP-CTERM sorting domain-containing protein [Terriglobales bacterium]|jgi:hypothetical protein|nr:PEP-CTERM sorting domain-containing protein [Terriglobales bacterium]